MPDVGILSEVCSILFERRLRERPNTLLLIAAMLTTLCISALAEAPLNDAEVAEMLAAHNAVRRRVARAESQRLGGTVRIPDLVWDSTLATVAQEWADSLIKRNPPRGGHRKQEELQQLDLGENWYLAWWEGHTGPVGEGRGGELGRGGEVV